MGRRRCGDARRSQCVRKRDKRRSETAGPHEQGARRSSAMLRGAAGVATGLTLMVERAQKVEKAKRKLMVSLGARLGRGFGRRRATELGQQWRMVALVAAMRGRRRERARERERGEAQMDEEGEAGTAGRSWWPTRACPGRRMRATRLQSPAGSPWRHGAAGRRTWTWARGGGWRVRGLGRLRPAGQKRGGGLLVPLFSLFHFFGFLFQNIFQPLFDLFKIFFRLCPQNKS